MSEPVVTPIRAEDASGHPSHQLRLDMGPAGIEKERVVLEAAELRIAGPFQFGQRRRLIVDVVVDGANARRSKGEVKWILEVRSAEEAP